jgi:AraC-like DNA-binding protein
MIVYQRENLGRHHDYRSNVHRDWVMPPHIHEYSELAFTKSGTSTVIVNGCKYLLPPHHLIFILPNQIHEYTDETASTLRCAVFSNDHIPIFFELLGDAWPENPVLDLSDHRELLEALDQSDPSDTLRICGLLNLICDTLLKSGGRTPINVGKYSLYYEVIEYISQNFKEDIRLGALAKRLGYHEKYLSSALHALTGMNFRSFLASYRIDYAKHLLRGRESRVSEVALQSGFSSINSFNRAFFAIVGMTPTQYRALRLPHATESTPDKQHRATNR